MTKLTWHLEAIDWNGVNAGTHGREVEIILNTKIENFFTLADVWEYIGGRLKKYRNGYGGIRNNIEYRLTRLQ